MEKRREKLFGDAFVKAAVMQTAISGFRKTGIYPLNEGVFTDWMFSPSETTERRLGDHENETLHVDPLRPSIPTVPISNEASATISDTSPPFKQVSIKVVTPMASRSSSLQPSCSFSSVSPRDIFKLPQATRKPPDNKRKRGKAAVITSSPYKAELEEDSAKRPTKRGVKNLKFAEAKNLELAEGNKAKFGKKMSELKIKSASKKLEDDSESSEEEEQDDACLYCNELFSNSKENEGWIKCVRCEKWLQDACAGCDDDESYFICDFCA